MLKMQLSYWRGYPSALRDLVRVVVVDDGSPRLPAADVLKSEALPLFDLRLFRIKENIQWNVPGAKNLGVTQAKTDWIYLGDIDHVLPAVSIERLCEMELSTACFYSIGRKRAVKMAEDQLTFKLINSHIDTFVMSRAAYWNIGGYLPKRLGSYYKGPCQFFRKQVQRHLRRVELNDVFHIFFDDSIVPDAITTDFPKDSNPARGEFVGPLWFNWEEVVL